MFLKYNEDEILCFSYLGDVYGIRILETFVLEFSCQRLIGFKKMNDDK